MKKRDLIELFVLGFFFMLFFIFLGFLIGFLFNIPVQIGLYGKFTFAKLKNSILTFDPLFYIWVIGMGVFPGVQTFINAIKFIITLYKKNRDHK